jgi:hypothetical protein
MPQNFIDCDREQAFLLPPSLRDWLPEDHLAWFVIEAVGRLDLRAFYAAYRADGHGVNGHRELLTGGHEFPHWWPSFLPTGGHESPHRLGCGSGLRPGA